jgi:hypothetical protein
MQHLQGFIHLIHIIHATMIEVAVMPGISIFVPVNIMQAPW